MIRVGFVLTFDAHGWLGGISYFRNLLNALAVLPDRRIEPIIFAGTCTDSRVLGQFSGAQVVRSALFDRDNGAYLARRVVSRLTGRDHTLERLLSLHRVDALSHQGFLGRVGRIPVLGWIPDFQDRHLPELFSHAELRGRMRNLRLVCAACEHILVSSHDAARDLSAIDARCAGRARVLQFVADVPTALPEDCSHVARRLGVEGPYFHLPNQFWAHKNHALVVDALGELKAEGVNARVIATGNTSDHRQPRQFEKLMERVTRAGVADRFHITGVLEHVEVIALMTAAVAVINPSRFEGWSTTVEEAKSLGRKVLLSDLRVHREQAPARGEYFSPADPAELARLMHRALDTHDPVLERLSLQEALEQLPRRRRAFADTYQRIVLELTAS